MRIASGVQTIPRRPDQHRQRGAGTDLPAGHDRAPGRSRIPPCFRAAQTSQKAVLLSAVLLALTIIAAGMLIVPNGVALRAVQAGRGHRSEGCNGQGYPRPGRRPRRPSRARATASGSGPSYSRSTPTSPAARRRTDHRGHPTRDARQGAVRCSVSRDGGARPSGSMKELIRRHPRPGDRSIFSHVIHVQSRRVLPDDARQPPQLSPVHVGEFFSST